MIRFAFLPLCALLLAACTPAESPPATTDDDIDLIVPGDYVVTMDPELTVIADGAVAVDEGVIIDVGTAADIEARYTCLLYTSDAADE